MTEGNANRGRGAAPGSPEERAAFAKAENLAFQVLGRRRMSIQVAGEALKRWGRNESFSIEEAALTAAVQAAEQAGVGGGAPPPAALKGQGGMLEEGNAAGVLAAFPALDPNTRALLLAHFILELPRPRTAIASGLDEGSVGMNVGSALRRLRALAGGAARVDGCGDLAAAAVVERTALGAGDTGDDAVAGSHIASGCSSCRALDEALRKERATLKTALQPLAEPSASPDSLLESYTIFESMKGGGLYGEGKGSFPRISRGAGIAIALLLGLLGAGALVLSTDSEFLLSFFTDAIPPADSSTSTEPAADLPFGAPAPAMTLEQALDGLQSKDALEAQRARVSLIDHGKSRLEDLLGAYRAKPELKEPLQRLFRDLGLIEISREERELNGRLIRLKEEADGESQRTTAEARGRIRGLDESAEKMQSQIDALTSRSAPESQIAPWRLRLKDIGQRRAQTEAEIGHAAASAEKRLRFELHSLLQRAETRRQIMNARSGILLLQGKKPAFPSEAAVRAQESLPIPPPADPHPMLPEALAAYACRWTDIPIVTDPVAAKGAKLQEISGMTGPVLLKDLVSAACTALDAQPVLLRGALLLSRPDRPLPPHLLRHLAGFLSDVDPRARFAAAAGFERLTWKSFGFDPLAPVDARTNAAAIAWMREWWGKQGPKVVQDPETELYGVEGEDWED